MNVLGHSLLAFAVSASLVGCEPATQPQKKESARKEKASALIPNAAPKGATVSAQSPKVVFLPANGSKKDLSPQQALRAARRQKRRETVLAQRKAREAAGIVIQPKPEIPMTEANRAFCDRIQAANDANDLPELLKIFAEAKSSDDPRVRQELVDAFASFDAKDSLQPLTELAFDANADVVQAATGLIQMKIGEVESEPDRAELIASYMKTLTGEDAHTMLAAEINALSDEKLQIKTICSVLEGGSPDAIKAAKESYEFVTGEKYTGPEAAQKWLEENHASSDSDGS